MAENRGRSLGVSIACFRLFILDKRLTCATDSSLSRYYLRFWTPCSALSSTQSVTLIFRQASSSATRVEFNIPFSS